MCDMFPVFLPHKRHSVNDDDIYCDFMEVVLMKLFKLRCHRFHSLFY